MFVDCISVVQGRQVNEAKIYEHQVLIIRVFDLCVKLLAVLHISNAEG